MDRRRVIFFAVMAFFFAGTGVLCQDNQKAAPPEWLSSVKTSIQQEEYFITPAPAELKSLFQAPNRFNGFRTCFDRERVRIVPRDGERAPWSLELQVATEAGTVSRIEITKNRMERVKGNLTEVFVNDADGLSHLLMMEKPGATNRSGVSSIDILVSGTLLHRLSEDARSVDLFRSGGMGILRYSLARVTDSSGRHLRARFEKRRGGVGVSFEDRGARYPVTAYLIVTGAAWTAEGDQDSAMFGVCTATAGDVNGDGYSDVIVGACYYDNGQGNEGRAYVYHGSASGPAATAGWTAESDQAGAYFGNSVATAGDVNGDGYSDIIVGAPEYDNGQTNEGRAFVYLGSATGLSAAADWTAESGSNSAYFGTVVACAGDVNRDGYSDVIIGAHNYETSGRAFVYHGSSSGLSAAPNWTAQGRLFNADRFGYSVSTAGDVNGDGYSDVAVGAMYYDNGQRDEGMVYVYHGSASGLSATSNWAVESNQMDSYLGMSVSAAGDVNGDGYSDLIVGAPFYDNGHADEGRAFVYMGSASGLGASAGWTAESDQGGAYMGYSVSAAGDVNGDGFSDVIVGAPSCDNDQADEGRAYVYQGSASGLGSTAIWSGESDQSGSSYGCSVATAGDVNGDGFSDIVVAARDFDNGETNEGRVFLYYGSASSVSTTPVKLSAGQAYAQFGFSVASAGDVNGDGYSDVVVGSPYFDAGFSDEGAVFICSGSATGLGAPQMVATGGENFSNFGWSAAGAGDVNGDGYCEVIVGAPGAFGGFGPGDGAACLMLGSAAGLDPTKHCYNSGQAGAAYGRAVGTAGDVNGDGYSDVCVGAHLFDGGQADEGAMFVYYGSQSGLAATPLRVEPDQAGAYLGYQTAAAGDVDGDGYSDLLASAPGIDPPGTGEGVVYLFHGSPSGLETASPLVIASPQDNADFGGSLGTAGDVNGDGFSDVLVGSPYFDNGESNEGAAFLYFGAPSGLDTLPLLLESNQAESLFGCSVSSAGDVNGDGFSDVAVGAVYYDNGQAEEGAVFLFHGTASGLNASPLVLESDLAGAGLGNCVASAGDANGDGYADLVAGASNYQVSQPGEGALLFYFGNGGPGYPTRPMQSRPDLSAPLALLGGTSGLTFSLSSLGRSSFGRGEVKLEWQVAPLGGTFDPVLNPPQEGASWTDSGTSGEYIRQPAALTDAGPCAWRQRTKYHPASLPFQGHGPWLILPGNGPKETDLRSLGSADLGVSQTDAPDPQISGGEITYHLTVHNGGPTSAPVTLTDTIPPGTTFVSATPSQGTYSYFSGVVTCQLGMLASGAEATVSVVVSPSSSGNFTNEALVSSVAEDPDPVNNSSSETTTVLGPSIGNRVWMDADGDGIQDAGEVGMDGVVVKLYGSDYSLVSEKLTDPSGAYIFTGLTFGSRYIVKVFLPSSDYSFSQPDRGGDDSLDSDVAVLTGQTPMITLESGSDAVRWDAGITNRISCEAPDEPVWIYLVTLSVPDDFPVLHIQDPNQQVQRTGYHIRRSDDPSTDKSTWPLVATNVVDMDQATPNIQWTDTSGDEPGSPYFTWFYQATAYNAYCPAEGPF